MEGGILVNDTTNTLCTVPYLLKIKKYLIHRVQKARLFLTLKKVIVRLLRIHIRTYVSQIYDRFQNFELRWNVPCTYYVCTLVNS